MVSSLFLVFVHLINIFYTVVKRLKYGKPLPYGELIGTVMIDGIELEVFSNFGFEDRPTENIWMDLHDRYLGYKYHCVSLVRRYLYFKTGKNFAELWKEGDAKDWYKNAEVMNLIQIPDIKDLEVGDLICFERGVYDIGHIGFVREKNKDGLIVTHQNVAQNQKDLAHFIPFQNPDFDRYIFQGGLRVPEEQSEDNV